MNKKTQELYQAAVKFAGIKHDGQSMPHYKASYMVHISNVAMEVMLAYQNEPNFDLDLAVQIALLHDTIEDTNTTYEEICELFSASIADGVLALTKDESLPKEDQMIDSLNRIKLISKEAKLVKICDRITNLQSPPDSWDKQKIIKYHSEAKQIANAMKGENSYLDVRIEERIKAYEQYF
ncbi:MAG: bifunctional (p)ppGpp synthetase/guanosine-3',5'-bis(diphosphate) 3'-pyrophosphohydrolase [Flavobacteriales bacterium]|nr:bifunctional (p)ppGpp synthetase/guanosine-3',5'-bis(diphosphate) 3'-pyrophosphohydrolase [Flavobacteriales bacterium]MCB9196362.1 bifunctional (p)ppGpp synthetase/guanosine-3',5'-bis(diphosphate) 3'-pyrophosphohydrolase [Flavobacteriales bacterium]MCB9198555.1 bifunctional (p)ppGpp synthetase/guanosine-3',5'-bis(diphosphate) 3'-pyrophosphohydrolase [Flavobacteriales bacterium]